MIQKALDFTAKALNQFILNKFGLDDNRVILNKIIHPNGSIPLENQNKVVLSLLNLEEETTKPFYHRMQPVTTGSYENKATSTQYNLFTLITPVFDDYNEGLKFLDATVQFFQINSLIDDVNNTNLPVGISKLAYELQKDENYTHLQNLWTALGAKYQPSVRYKIRIITAASDERQGFKTNAPETNNNQ